MYYVSTRDASLRYTAAQAIVQGLSREGGLFLPSEIPQLSREDLTELTRCSYPERAAHIMGLYLDDFSQEELLGFAEKAYGPAKFDTRWSYGTGRRARSRIWRCKCCRIC